MRVAYAMVPHVLVGLARRDHPELAGQPIVVADGPGRTARVVDAAEAAEAAGVAVGMTLIQAREVLPGGAFLVADPARVEAAAAGFAAALAALFPTVEIEGPAAAYVDLAGLRELLGDEPIIGRQIVVRVQQAVGLTPCVGIADGKFPAQAAARTAEPGRPRIVPPGGAAAFLAPLPADLLPASAEVGARLGRLGLHSLGQVAALPPGPIQAQFGAEGRFLRELAQGRDERPVVASEPERPLRERLTLPAPTVQIEPLLVAARQLLARLAARPELRGQAARRLTVRAECLDGGVWERRLSLRPPTADPEGLLGRVRTVLAAATLPGPAEELELALAQLTPGVGLQRQLFGDKVRDRQALREAVRSLQARFGRSPLMRVVEVEPWSRIPERRLALIDYEP